MKTLFPLSVLAVACASSPLSSANDKLEELIVTSSRVEMPLRQVGTSVSVISGDEIRQRGFNTLYEVLRSQPAVAVSNTGGPGSATSLRIRGEEAHRTLVRLDGIDISDASGTQIGPKFEHLMSSGIQRVEVLRGPQGLMYGADAGGVVNITTQAPVEGFGGEVSAEAGRYGTQELAADLGGSTGQVDFTLSAVDFETDGFNARTTDTVLRDDDGYENTTLHGKFGWNVSEAFRLELVARDVEGENLYDGCFLSDDCSNTEDQSAWRVSANYNTEAFTHELSYSGNDTERTFYTAGVPGFSTEGTLEQYSYLGSYSSSDALRLVYGVDLETASLDDGSADTERDQDGYYAEYQGNFGNQLYITAGVRYDDNEDFGTHTSYRVSGAYLFDMAGGSLKLRSAYGTGFRAPSLSEIAYNEGAFSYPPASEVSLSEEKSEGLDIGVSWFADSGLYLEAIYFDQTVSDEIFFDLDTFSGYLQGDGDNDSSGVELIAEVPLTENLLLTGNYTYNDTENSEGVARARRPEQLANLGLRWRTLDDRLTLGMNLRAAYDALDTAGEDLDDYEVVDINGSFEILTGLEIFGRVENLFDEDYEEVRTFNTSGTAAYAGVRYAF
jgi:vitamin B12 transporter